jgi:vacuolar protein sorting-associated protein 26
VAPLRFSLCLLQSFFGFGGSSAEIDIKLKDSKNLQTVLGKNELGEPELHYLFTGTDTVAGTISIDLKQKRLEHQGIKVELLGQIEFGFDRSNPYEFTSLVRELEGIGALESSKTYDFEFPNVDKSYETYHGNNVRLRYFLRVRIARQYASNIVKTLDLAVQNIGTEVAETNNSPIKMEVGIEDCLHIEFEYNKRQYHLTDVVIGKIYFLLVRIKIKHMEIVIIKRESCGTGQGPNSYNESENLAKFEIMDGAPVRGETIPIRLFLQPYTLTPTLKNVHNKFSVKYYLNLVLVDEEDRRYFKQQEIQLWRKQFKTATQADVEEAKQNK